MVSIPSPDLLSLIPHMAEEAIGPSFVAVELLKNAVMRDSNTILLLVGVLGVHRGEIDGCPISGCEGKIST